MIMDFEDGKILEKGKGKRKRKKGNEQRGLGVDLSIMVTFEGFQWGRVEGFLHRSI